MDCSYNEIKSLNNLPNSLEILNCSNNNIKSLINLPKSLIEIKFFKSEFNKNTQRFDEINMIDKITLNFS